MSTETVVEERPFPDGDGTGSVDMPDVVSVTCRLKGGAVASYDFSV